MGQLDITFSFLDISNPSYASAFQYTPCTCMCVPECAHALYKTIYLYKMYKCAINCFVIFYIPLRAEAYNLILGVYVLVILCHKCLTGCRISSDVKDGIHNRSRVRSRMSRPCRTSTHPATSSR